MGMFHLVCERLILLVSSGMGANSSAEAVGSSKEQNGASSETLQEFLHEFSQENLLPPTMTTCADPHSSDISRAFLLFKVKP